MKFGVFADPHYCQAEKIGPLRRPKASLEKVKRAMDAFKQANVELCFCIGDIIDVTADDTKESVLANLREIMSVICSYQIPFFLIPGNHDYLLLKGEDLERETGGSLPPCTVRTRQALFVLLDGNYRSDMRRFDEAGENWLDCNLPSNQIRFIKEECAKENLPCVVLIHENLDPSAEVRHLIKNAAEVRAAIAECGNVKMVLQGHYHPGVESVVDGIPYITLPAVCEKDAEYYRIYKI